MQQLWREQELEPLPPLIENIYRANTTSPGCRGLTAPTPPLFRALEGQTNVIPAIAWTLSGWPTCLGATSWGSEQRPVGYGRCPVPHFGTRRSPYQDGASAKRVGSGASARSVFCAVACFLAAAVRHLRAAGGAPKGSISFLITGDEEGPSINGTMKVLAWLAARGETARRLPRRRAVEPACVGRRDQDRPARLAHRRHHRRRQAGPCRLSGQADNPVPKLARIMDRLSTRRSTRGTAHFEPSNLQFTVISVPNTATNVIPADARATFNIRYNDTWTRARRSRPGCASSALRPRRASTRATSSPSPAPATSS